MGLGMFFGFIAFYNPAEHWWQNRVFDLMVQRTYGAMTNDVLISIPLFVLMGYVMERGALVDKMFYSIQLAFRRVPASLAVATLIVCTFWGIACGLVGAVVVLMGVIAFNPMLRAGYDVKLAAGVITAGGTLGILIPPSVMIIVYAAVAGQSVVKLYAAAMFPGFFLAFLYLVYVIGWALINPKIAPPLPEEQTRVPVPAWMHAIPGALFAQHVRRRCSRRCSRRAKARGLEIDGKPMTYWALVKQFRDLAGAVDPDGGHALCSCGGTSSSTNRPAPRRRRGLAAARRRRCTQTAARRRQGAADQFYSGSASSPSLCAALMLRYYWRMTGERFEVIKLLTSSVDAARHPDRHRARRDPVRHHDRDRIRRGRRRRRLPPGVPCAHARLEAHQGGGVPHRQDHRDGVLAVRRLGAVLGGVRDPRRSGAGRAMGARRSTCRPCSS